MILLAALILALTGCILPTQAVDLEGQLWEQMGTSALEDAAEGTFSVKEGTNLQKGLGVLASQASEQVDAVLHSEGVPRCKCGGMIRPDVVLYEEPLDDETVAAAVRSIAEADMLIVGGTSLRRYFQGDELVLVNRDATPYDGAATLVLRGSIGAVLGPIR